METSNSDYDYDSTIFSPDGRLFQVEYARETIKKGATTIGLKYLDGVAVITYKDTSSYLIEKKSTNKIKKIDDNIIFSYVGLSADARYMLDYSQEIAAIYKIWYDDYISIKELVIDICMYKHLFTTYAGIRPFGLSLFIAGYDFKGYHLYKTDPSGAFFEYKATCDGRKSNVISNYLEKNYKTNLTKEKAIKFSFDSIKKTTKKSIGADNFEVGIMQKREGFYKLSDNEITNIME